MIQEKDFLYRVPVKTAPITTPGGQIRNPEILVDVEGGEFMHGNILDANSTNKLINQSVKDAVDNKLIESGYVTKDLLEAETTRATEQENSLKTLIGAETSARTKGDEDLSSKIKAEQTRAEGKEKEISDKLAIVNGDSNTEGSFRKAIADVVAAAPEDLDTLKEIADKLAGNDDLHTALNQAITEKADSSALLNEVTRATGAESGLQAAIATKADATALSNYVLTTALNQQIDTLNAAISAKQDAGNYIPYDASVAGSYQVDKTIAVKTNDVNTATFGPNACIMLKSGDTNTANISYSTISLKTGDYSFTLDPSKIAQVGVSYAFDVNTSEGVKFSIGESFAKITPLGFFSNQNDLAFTVCNANDFIDIKSLVNQIVRVQPTFLYCSNGPSSIQVNTSGIYLTDDGNNIILNRSGITLPNGDYDHVLTSYGSTINIGEYATKSDLSAQLNPKADRSDLMALEQKVTANTTAIEDKQDAGYYVTYIRDDGKRYTLQKGFEFGDATGNVAIDGSGVDINIAGSSITLDDAGIMGNDGGNNHYSIDYNGINLFNMDTEIRISPIGISSVDNEDTSLFNIDSTAIILGPTNNPNVKINEEGIKFKGKAASDIPTAGGTFINLSSLASAEDISNLSVGLSKKQNKITVNEVDVTDIETADITKLRTIVTNLINALSESDLIRKTETLE